jgi:predicted ABC-type ATPase
MPELKPILTIIAGPNGSGKSTFTRAIRESLGVPVIDPDLEARSLQPDAPEAVAIQGGRQAIKRARAYLENNESFAAETTLSGNTYLRMIAESIKLTGKFDITILKKHH